MSPDPDLNINTMTLIYLSIAGLALLALYRLLPKLQDERQRKLLWSSVRRALRWEFWPMWLFYIPVVVYIIGLVIRYRGLTFTAANPGLPGGGFIGEKKSFGLEKLRRHQADFVADFEVIPLTLEPTARMEQALAFMARKQLDFPVILKPDYGQRGIGVQVIRDQDAMRAYLQQADFDTIIQTHVGGEEFGVFYVRLPQSEQGFIFSITHKCFPTLTGDGHSTLEQLILNNPRTHYMARFLLTSHADQLTRVLAAGERFQTVEIGSHCRGSLFLDGADRNTPALSAAIDSISKDLPGFFFGRYDIRTENEQDFVQGHNFKIIEVNGVTSEATHIYDPKYSVIDAYKTLFKQWHWAFKVGRQNIEQGCDTLSPAVLIHKVRTMNSE